MASNYTGNPTAVQAPGAAPGPGVAPIISLPADADGATFANLYQALKECADYIAWLTSLGIGAAAFGDGSDGTVTLDGTVTVPWASKSGSNYTLTRDVNLINLSLNAGVSLFMGNATATYRLYGQGTLTLNSTAFLGANGGSTATPTAGVGFGAGSVGGSGSGGNGQAAIGGGTGVSTTGSLGGSAGAGGHGPATTSGVAGTATVAPDARGSSHASFGQWMGHILGTSGGVSTPTVLTGGAGGGGGGGDNSTNQGGGGGAGGGVVLVSFRSIVMALATQIAALGGNGASTGLANAGGGGGGGGGYIRLVYALLTIASGTLAAATNCTGGSPGSAGAGGTVGVAGAVGTLESIKIA